MTSLRYSLNLKNGGVISLVGAGGKTSLMFRLARELSGQGDPVLTTTTTKIYMPNRKQSSIVIISNAASTLATEAGAILKRNLHISAGSRLIPFQNKLKGFRPEAIDALWQSGIFRWILVEADGAAGRPVKAPAAHEPVIPQCTKWVIGIVGLKAVGKPLTERWVFRPQRVSQITGLAEGSILNESSIAHLLMDEDGIFKGAPAGATQLVFLNQADCQDRLENGRNILQRLIRKKKQGFERIIIGQTIFEPMVKEYYPK